MVKVTLTEEQKALAISLAVQGKRMEEIRQALKICAADFWFYRENNPNFSVAFARARDEGYDELQETLLTIPDEYEDVNRARLKSDNLKWSLSKRKPATYGDRIDLNISNKLDLSAVLLPAEQRLRLLRDSQKIVDAEIVETKHLISSGDTDNKSPAPEIHQQNQSPPQLQPTKVSK